MLSQTSRQRGIDFYQNRKFIEATQEFKAWLQQNPDDHQIRLLSGLSFQQSGNLDEAATEFQKILLKDQQNSNATYSLARIQYLRGQLPEAERLAVQAGRLGSPRAGVLHLRGLIAKEKQNDTEALKHFTDARKADKNYIPAYLAAAEVLIRQGQPQQSISLLDQAITRSPGAEAFYLRARARLALNQTQEALADLKRSIDLGGDIQAQSLYERLSSTPPSANISAPPDTKEIGVASVSFEEIGRDAGLLHRLVHKNTEEKYLIETMAGGVAAFDFDGDGLIDLFFTNGADLPSLKKSSPAQWNRLYRNEGNFRFRDVTKEMKVMGEGFSTGVTVGDFNNDGRPDLFVAGFGHSQLYRNDGTHFTEISQQAGLKQQPWPITAGWFDYDNDGHLDLLIVNYLDWSPAKNIFCGDPKHNFRVYCHPRHFGSLSNTLYRNNRDGTFDDVSEKSEISKSPGKGMSVAFADYDGDGWTDFFITNDAIPNSFFRNKRNGTFEEIALTAGVALTDDGVAISSMGVDFQDYDNDGLPDLVITALVGETFPLFRNLGKGTFADWSLQSLFTKASKKFSGWGIHFADLNNDGWKDIFTANSHVTDNIEQFSSDVYLLPNTVFLNHAGKISEAVSIPAMNQRTAAHRGSVIGDFDNDGRLDIAIAVLGESPELWRNTTSSKNNWLQVKLEGMAYGAVIQADDQWFTVSSTSGYASSISGPVHIGLGNKNQVEKLSVKWTDGTQQTLTNIPANQQIQVRKKATAK